MIESPPALPFIYLIATDMRDMDYHEISALSWCQNRPQLATMLAQRYADLPTGRTFLGPSGDPIAFLGWDEIRPGVWQVAMFATDKFDTIGNRLTRWVIRYMIPALDRAGCHRLETQSMVGHESAHRWLRFLGMESEAVLRGFGRNGEDYHVFAWRREDGQQTVRWRKPGVVEWAA